MDELERASMSGSSGAEKNGQQIPILTQRQQCISETTGTFTLIKGAVIW
jgi:hypothetical protein